MDDHIQRIQNRYFEQMASTLKSDTAVKRSMELFNQIIEHERDVRRVYSCRIN